MYKIVIKNTVTNQEYVYDNIEDINGGKKLYYNFNIDTSNLSDGEYKLTLFKGDDIVCTELLKVGDFNSEKIQYSKGANVFIDAKPVYDITNITITANGEYTAPELTAYDTISVDVPAPKISVQDSGIKFAYFPKSEIPDYYDFDGITNMERLFYSSNLTILPKIDTTNVTSLSYTFAYTNFETLPYMVTTNVTSLYYAFTECRKLTTLPNLDTRNVDTAAYFLQSCSNLVSLPEFDFGSVTSFSAPFGYSKLTKLTDIGGFKNLKCSVTSYFLDYLPNLTVDSLMNVINGLWDWTDYPDGKAPINNGTIKNFGKTHTLKIGQTNLDKLTAEQIAVATAKGWTLTA